MAYRRVVLALAFSGLLATAASGQSISSQAQPKVSVETPTLAPGEAATRDDQPLVVLDGQKHRWKGFDLEAFAKDLSGIMAMTIPDIPGRPGHATNVVIPGGVAPPFIVPAPTNRCVTPAGHCFFEHNYIYGAPCTCKTNDGANVEGKIG